MSAPRIALIRQRHTDFGGAERFLGRLLEALGGRAELTVIARRWPAQAGVTVHVCDPRHLGRLSRDRGFARCAQRHLAHAHYDLVQSHERIPGCDLYRAGDGVHAAWLAARARVLSPLQRLAQTLNPWHRYTLAAERRMFEHPRLRAVICNSEMVREEILRRFRIAPEKLRVIHNGVDTERFHPRLRAEHRAAVRAGLGVADDRFVALFVGSGFERKGLATAIRAIARVESAELWVVGKDKHQRRYEALAVRLGVAARVRFLGPQRDVAPYYASADALVLPAVYEPFANVVLEALACGLPVLTSPSNGASAVIAPGRNGFVHDALDAAGYAEALRAMADPARREAMREAARASAEPFTLAAMGDQLMRLYQDLLPDHS